MWVYKVFKFLKNKIQDAVKKFSKNTDVEEVEELTPQEESQLSQEEAVLSDESDKLTSDANDDEKIIDEVVDEELLIEDDVSNQEEISDGEEVLELTSNEDTKEILADDVDVDDVDASDSKDLSSTIDQITDDSLIEKSSGEDDAILSQKNDIVSADEDLSTDLSNDGDGEVSIALKEDLSQDSTNTESSDKVALDGVEDQKQDDLVDTVSKESKEVVDHLAGDVVNDLKTTGVTDEETPKKKGFFSKLFSKKDPVIEPSSDDMSSLDSKDEVSDDSSTLDDIKKEKPLDELDEIADELEEDQKEISSIENAELLEDVTADATKKKKGFFAKIKEKVVKFQLTDEVFEDLFWDFELALLENNVALEVIEKIKNDLHDRLTQENVSRKGVDQVILNTLKSSLDEVLSVDTFDFIERVSSKKPYVISMIGVNGSGKTTTLAKVIHLLQQKNLSVVVAASDTFRAAAIQQLQEHTDKLGVKLIKHDYNADPSAVAFDAISHAKAKDIDVVLIDTAGRLQSNSNLMDELRKLIRVNKPDMNIFIGESVTGNDCVEQALAFNESVGIDGIILSKADIDEKGGAAISVSHITQKPILYLGTGQTYGDLKPFSKFEVLDNLGL
jgi:fused signal recognition particle receptor